jgi:hypothetical protein
MLRRERQISTAAATVVISAATELIIQKTRCAGSIGYIELTSSEVEAGSGALEVPSHEAPALCSNYLQADVWPSEQ